MTQSVTIALVVAATAANGLLAGASLDQSIKQLPARHRMGASAFSIYSQASDLSARGIIWYAVLGLGAALLTLAAAGAAFFQHTAALHAVPLSIAAALALLHSFATTQAAPTNFKQRQVVKDEAALTAIFTHFERWQTLRVVVQVLSFAAVLWALTTYLS